MPRPAIPESMRPFYFDFDWSNARVWALDLPVEVLPLADLTWHLDVPVWSTAPGEPRFDLRPRAVLRDPHAFPRHFARLLGVDPSYPLDVMWTTDRYVILDGIHRLARLVHEGREEARIRRVPRTAIPHIAPAGSA